MLETGIITLTGAVIGLGGAKLLYKASNFNAAGFLPGFDVTTDTLLLGAGVALLLMLASGLVPADPRRAAPGGAGAEDGRMKIPLTYNARSLLQRPVSTAAHRARHRPGGGRLHRHAGAGQRLSGGAHPHRLEPRTCWCCGRGPTPSCPAAWTGRPPASSPRRPTCRPGPTAGRW